MEEKTVTEFVVSILESASECDARGGDFIQELRYWLAAHGAVPPEFINRICVAFANHLAENAVVSREDLVLLTNLGEQVDDELLHIDVLGDGPTFAGSVMGGDSETILDFGVDDAHKTARDAINSLLKPREPSLAKLVEGMLPKALPDTFIHGGKVYTVTATIDA